MINNTFQLDRFSKVIGRTFKQNKKAWFTSMLVFVGVPLLLFLFILTGFVSTSLVTRRIYFYLIVPNAFILSPLIYFYSVNHPKKGLNDVMLPASVFEKYLNMMLFCMIIVPISALVLYVAMDSLIALIFPQYFNGFAIDEFMNLFRDWIGLLNIFLIMQIVFFFNVLFSSRKILKTIVAFMLIGVAITILSGTVMIIADQAGVFESLATNDITKFEGERGYFDIYKSDHFLMIFIQLIKIFLQIVLPVGLMIGSYFVLKNKRY